MPQRFKDQINKSKLRFIGCIFKLDFSALDTLTLTIAHIPILFKNKWKLKSGIMSNWKAQQETF